jgi:hypothetical protein
MDFKYILLATLSPLHDQKMMFERIYNSAAWNKEWFRQEKMKLEYKDPLLLDRHNTRDISKTISFNHGKRYYYVFWKDEK